MEVNFQAGLDASPEPTQDDERTQALSDTRLRRGLSARQVQMIAIGGTIGTGLFLGTGRSLAEGGPASMLICYAIIGFVVYVTLLLLGEMATQYPVAGECGSTPTFVIPTWLRIRVLHHLCHALFLSCIWLCGFVELLVQ